ncbi:glycosyltransferase [Ramlibacter tataouinensis]|uniref:Animal glycogenin, Glycosyltransferase Family 8-like protein n=1 Tax=Ramlibacter tataouinensis (strain ATCC BAA-407 / DSM 14655 / LMG 21543 / TTB310) TaxID=365046 RepID=F5XY28_RAMTT|nr:glycosyltransferase [Ramlibacter tataouinensis]AEG94353.1 animal glycogenin, Glycosyltransferase Family 8-like protein [Ramlibacter tataouinensis TTB310]
MKAYVTLLSTADYLPGVLCLAKSLRATGTPHPLVVGLSASLPAECDEVLRQAQLPTVRLPAASPVPRTMEQNGHHWGRTFDKLHLFGLAHYSKLVYLDSDMLVLSSLDELFERPHLSAVPAGRLVHPDWDRLNSGLMVIEPDADLPRAIGNRLDNALATAAQAGNQAIGDQDLINAWAPGWPSSGLQLDEGYNVFDSLLDDYLDRGYALPTQPGGDGAKPVKVVHFIGPVKPWHPRALGRHWLRSLQGRTSPAQRQMFRLYRHWLRQPLRPTSAAPYRPAPGA